MVSSFLSLFTVLQISAVYVLHKRYLFCPPHPIFYNISYELLSIINNSFIILNNLTVLIVIDTYEFQMHYEEFYSTPVDPVNSRKPQSDWNNVLREDVFLQY